MPGRPAGLAVLLAVLAQSCNSVRAEASSVIQLTEGNFDKLTASGEWLVTISAPWCFHCRNLEPTWKRVAERLVGRTNVAAVNAEEYPALATRFHIPGFPSIFHLRPGETRQYEGDRSEEDLVHFALEGWRDTAPVPFWRSPNGALSRVGVSLSKIPDLCLEYSSWLQEDLHVPLLVILMGCLAIPVTAGMTCLCLWDARILRQARQARQAAARQRADAHPHQS